jgi:predicted dehydrogenase
MIPSSAWARDGRIGPNDLIQIGCIGTGPQGRGVMGNFLGQTDCRVVAVCDVKKDQLEIARTAVNQKNGNQDCRTYHDFRQLLARSDIDAVLVATPDHWHVVVGIAAANAGKDMYVEKPMGLTLAEDQALRAAVKKHKRVFQFGTQQRSSEQFRQACDLVRNGKIGQLQHMDVWSSASHPGGATAPIAPPPELDYDFWLGPARYTPYTENKAAADNKTWWFNYDYALGFIAGWGVHPLDIALWGHPGLMAGPLEIDGQGVFPSGGACNTAIAWDVQFRAADGVTMTYRGTPNGYDKITPMNDLEPWRKKFGHAADHGNTFVGTEGWILVDRGTIRAHPEKLLEEKLGPSDKPLTRSTNHARNFLDCVRSRQEAICDIDAAVQADVLCHLSDIATRLERKLVWNWKQEKFVDNKEANARLRARPFRKPWRL